MDLSKLKKTTQPSKRRGGQGLGSGRGKTAGRGTKGQKARGKVPLFFEGGALPLTKRLPFLRGRGRNASIKKSAFVVNVETLDKLPANSNIDIEFLIKNGIVPAHASKNGVKILGEGELSKSLTVNLPVTETAKTKIEKAGGKVLSE